MTGLLFSCMEPSAEQDSEQGEAQDSLEEKTVEPDLALNQKLSYPIPSPEQMFTFIKESGVRYSQELMQDMTLVDEINDPNKKALNFGVYIADLAYAAAYKDKEATTELYKLVKRMGADLSIEAMTTEGILEEVKANLQNADSLSVIASRAYYDAVEFLDKNDMHGKLALMSLGGWTESVYISLHAIEKFDPESDAIQRVADQKITFGNLYTFLRKHEDESGVKDALAKIQGIRSTYASLREERAVKRSEDDNGEKTVLSNGEETKISTAQFENLKSSISKLRYEITE